MRMKATPKRELIQGGQREPLARVRLGGPQTPSKKDPTKLVVGRNLETFRFVWNENHPHIDPVRAESVMRELYGDLKAITPVVFMRDAIDTVYQSANEDYRRSAAGNSVLLRRCDGESQILHRVENGGLSTDPIPCLSEFAGGPGCTCDPVGRLFFAIPEWSAAYGCYGEFMLIFGSTVGIETIGAVLDEVYQNTGYLRRWAFTLYRTPVTMNLKDGKTVTQSLVKLELAPMAAQGFAASLMSGLEADPALALPAPAPRLPASTGPVNAFPAEVKFTPSIGLTSDSEGVPAFWFQNESGKYAAYDPAVIAGIVPDFTQLKPAGWTKLPFAYLLGRIDGDEVIHIEGYTEAEEG